MLVMLYFLRECMDVCVIEFDLIESVIRNFILVNPIFSKFIS